MKIKELLTDESKWCQGAFAKNAVPSSREDAVCWCLAGANMRCHPKFGYSETSEKISSAVAPMILVDWNDAPERTFADVRKLVEELDI